VRKLLLSTICAALFASPATAGADTTVGAGGGTPGTSSGFEIVGHEPLFARGMNAAPAVYGRYVYVGNRTDGSPEHPHPGILIVDANDPSQPTVIGEIGAPHASQVGITTRELRVWPREKLLVVMTFRCSSAIHDCPPGNDTTFPFDIKFFDLSDPVHPTFLSSYVPTSKAGLRVKPHEMYLWVDPSDPERALLWLSTPSSSVNPDRPNLMIVDISDVAEGGAVREVAEGNWNQLFPGASDPANYDFDLSVHSMAPTANGQRTYLAYLRGGFLVLDTSKIANDAVPTGAVESLNDDLLTPVANRPVWGAGLRCSGGTAAGCSEGHSAVPLPGRPFALTTDEVYGTLAASSFGWPWGWSRIITTGSPQRPRIVADYKLQQNTEAFRPFVDPDTQQFTSYASHNPTLTRNLALLTWHSGGIQAIDTSDPTALAQAGWLSPTPLGSVATEDPALSSGPNKVVAWSYPIIRDGLVYFIDIRNGLYVARYIGAHASEVAGISFLEGNSNLGDAVRLGKGG
jgi:LVIVD repeat